jgi:hypothetical protein
VAEALGLGDALGAPLWLDAVFFPQARGRSKRHRDRRTGADHRAFGMAGQAFATMRGVPRFTPAQLLPLLSCEPGELAARTQSLAGRGSPVLVRQLLQLREAAAAAAPVPSSEELCLALLALLALDEAKP